MTSALITHPSCLAHKTPPGHPESPERLMAVLDTLKTLEFQQLVEIEAARARRRDLARCHTSGLLDFILRDAAKATRQRGFVGIDSDTFICADSAEAALRAACLLYTSDAADE